MDFQWCRLSRAAVDVTARLADVDVRYIGQPNAMRRDGRGPRRLPTIATLGGQSWCTVGRSGPARRWTPDDRARSVDSGQVPAQNVATAIAGRQNPQDMVGELDIFFHVSG